MTAKQELKHADDFPFDASDAWMNRESKVGPETPHWSYRAARGVISNLSDRRGIGQGIGDFDEDVRKEIVATLADIIRVASEEKIPKKKAAK